jgi:5-methylcytosine-specific restriction endonuclease McrA
MKNLRGFWKPPSDLVPTRVQELNYVKAKLRRKRVKKGTQKPPKRQPDDKFYKSIEWRSLRYQALKNCNGCCQLCGASQHDGIKLHVDHIKPRSRFPELALVLSNLQVLCDDCNIGKGGWDDTDWRQHMRAI